MKKLVALFIVVAFFVSFSLISCGPTEQKATTEQKVETKTETKTETKVEPAPPAPEKAVPAPEKPAPEPAKK
jgi:type IV secretory pathway VirB10-like protein